MRVSCLILVGIVLSPAVLAQNEIELWPGVTNFTSRGSVANNATGGEILQGLHESAFAGIGDNGVRSTVNGFGMILQDQNTDTQEPYTDLIYRTGSDAAGPNPLSTGVVCSLGPFTSPPRGTGGPVQAWTISHSVGTAPCLDLCTMNAFGLRLTQPPSPGWTADGLSVHMSRGDGTSAASVQCAASGAPDMAWQIINDVVTNPSLHRSWRFRIITEAATMQMGNGTVKYGQGGPNPAAGVPLTARARYGSVPSGSTSLLFFSTGRFCPGISLFPGMRVYLGGKVRGPFLQSIAASGEAIHDLTSTPSTSPGVALHFQAAAISGSGASTVLEGITNAASSDI